MLNAAIKASPAFGGTAEELRRRQGRVDEGREEGREGRATMPSPSSPTPGGTPRPRSKRCRSSGTKAPNAKVSSATIAEMLKAGLDADQAIVGNQGGDVKAALAGAAKKVEAVYAYPYQHHVTLEPQNATALYTPDKCEVWASVQNGEQALAATAEAVRHPGHQVRGLQDLPRRRVRPSRDLGRLRAAGGPRRQGDARHAGQADVDARRGHDPRLVPSDHPMQDDRRVRRQEEPDRPAHPHLRPVDPRDGGAGPHAERHGSRDLRGLLQGRRRRRRSATTCRTSWSTMPCAIRTIPPGSGAA